MRGASSGAARATRRTATGHCPPKRASPFEGLSAAPLCANLRRMQNAHVFLSDGRSGYVILDTVRRGNQWHGRVVVIATFGPAEVLECPSPDATERLARERARVMAELRYEQVDSPAPQTLHYGKSTICDKFPTAA